MMDAGLKVKSFSRLFALSLTRLNSNCSSCSFRLLHHAYIRRYLSTLPEYRELVMPKVSPTMTHGVLVSWKKNVGDHFEEDEELAEVESDKSTEPLRATDEGYLAKILVEEGSNDIPVGQIVGVAVEEEDMVKAFKDFSLPAQGDDKKEAEENKQVEEQKEQSKEASSSEGGEVAAEEKKYDGPMSPALVRLLNQYPTLQLGRVKPTGPKGRILKGDVLAAIEAGEALKPTESTSGKESKEQKISRTTKSQASKESTSETPPVRRRKHTDTTLSSMRRTIARRLAESKQTIPHFYTSRKYELDLLLELRKRLNEKSSTSISVNDFVIKAAAMALRQEPEVNSSWDNTSFEVKSNDSIDISMAVSIPKGLITPIVKRAASKSLSEIAAETKDLVARARKGELNEEEYLGGTFSTSNLGMFGTSSFSAVINPPQSAILAVGGGSPKIVLDADGIPRKATVGLAQLSTDARVVQAVSAAKFMNAFADFMSNPEMMIV